MKTILIALSAVLFLSCNSTQITSSWKADNAQQKDYKKIMVLGLMNNEDRSLREQIENEMVSHLRDLGYDAISGLQEYGPKSSEKITEEEMVTRLQSSKYDAVLTTVLLDVSKEETYQPGRVRYQPVGTNYNRFGRYYTTVYSRIYEPGYYTTSTQFFLESNFYDLSTGDIQYSVQSKTFNPSNVSSLSHDYTKRIIKDIMNTGLLMKK